MKKSSNTNLGSAFAELSHVFARYNMIVYFVFVALALGFCMIIIINIVNLSRQTDDNSVQPIQQTFDQSTIKRLNELDPASHPTPFRMPTGRTNPFAE